VSRQKITEFIIYYGSSIAVITLLVLIPFEIKNGFYLLSLCESLSVIILIINILIFKKYRNYSAASSVILILLYLLLTFALFVNNTQQAMIWYFLLPVVSSFLLGYRISRPVNIIIVISFIFEAYYIEYHSPDKVNAFFAILAFVALTAVSTLHEYTRFLAIEEAEKLSITDPLTGIFNRRHFDIELKKYMQDAKRSGLPLSLVIFDLDHFKKINDQFGHKMGDRALITITKIFIENFRSNDQLFRIGGEEFAVIACMNLLRASQMMERFMEILSEKKDEDGYPGTISVGITEMLKSDTEESFHHRADTVMYGAKKSGRNKICTV